MRRSHIVWRFIPAPASGCLRDEGALRQSLAEGDVLARDLDELDHQVVGRDAGAGGDARVQLLEEREARLLRPAGDERELEHDEVVGILEAEKRWRVQEALARQLVDDLEEVVRRDLQDADQRLLHRLRQSSEAGLVVAAFEHMDFCEGHAGHSGMATSRQRVAPARHFYGCNDPAARRHGQVSGPNHEPPAIARALINPKATSARLCARNTYERLPLERSASQPASAAIARRVRLAISGQSNRPAPWDAK